MMITVTNGVISVGVSSFSGNMLSHETAAPFVTHFGTWCMQASRS
jgi:hypothetical protein